MAAPRARACPPSSARAGPLRFGLLAVCADIDPDRREGTELTYLHGVAVTGPEVVAVLDRADDFSTATVELWLPVEAG